MGTVNTVFQPMGPSVAIASGAPLAAPNGQGEYRILNTTAAGAVTTFSWGKAPAVPTVAGPQTMSLGPNESLYLTLPLDTLFNVKAAGTIEVTPGQGGAGG